MKKYTLITDGACSGNPGPGGWCVIIKYNGSVEEIFDGEISTTNNIMELTAVIKGLEKITEPSNITVKTDSTYVINGISNWISKWKINGWKTASNKPVANKNLWIELDNLIQKHHIDWKWVKGHSGDYEIERADELAREGLTNTLKIKD